MIERIKTPTESMSVSVERGANHSETIDIHGRFEVICLGPDGQEKWRDVIDNLVTTVGRNDMLDKYLKGAAYTQTFRMGLKAAGSPSATDTQASHAGWLEQGLANAPTYTGNRKDVVMGSAVSSLSTSAVQVFSITSSGTVAGVFANNGGSVTKDDTTGVLFSAGDFVGGSKIVANGDTINVTYLLSI